MTRRKGGPVYTYWWAANKYDELEPICIVTYSSGQKRTWQFGMEGHAEIGEFLLIERIFPPHRTRRSE
jgi:hypothetical protein